MMVNRLKSVFPIQVVAFQKSIGKEFLIPFFTTKKVGEGTGLGLWVSYNIVKKHNGIITFETRTKEESEEAGTTFIIKLPAAKE